MEQILEDFLALVQIDTASKDEREIADVLKAKLVELGCTVEEDSVGEIFGGNTGNLFAVLEGTMEGSLMFSAHMDRVANGKNIKPRIEGGRIVSDGTILAADDVSGIAAILDGVRRIKASGKPHPRVEIIFSACEEDGLSGSKYFDYSKLESKMGFVLDSPGRIGRVINSAPSHASLEFEVHGKSTHAGNMPEQGINAVTAAARVLLSIKDGRIDEESTANFSIFEANCPPNVVNAYARAAGEARSKKTEKLKAYVAEFYAACRAVAEETKAVITPKVTYNFEAFQVPEDSKNINILRRVFQSMGKDITIEGGGGGLDANRYNAVGIPSVGVATGYSGNHSVNEYLELEDLLRAGEMVELIITEYANE